jgi:hypothetical protein
MRDSEKDFPLMRRPLVSNKSNLKLMQMNCLTNSSFGLRVMGGGGIQLFSTRHRKVGK